MSKKRTAIDYLKESEGIISNHTDAFSPMEAMRLALAMRYLLAYIEEDEKETNNNGKV